MQRRRTHPTHCAPTAASARDIVDFAGNVFVPTHNTFIFDHESPS